MADLTGKTIANTYKDLLQSGRDGQGLPADTPVPIQDGQGNPTGFYLSLNQMDLTGIVKIQGKTLTADVSVLNAVSDFTAVSGFATGNGAGEIVGRTFSASTGISISNADGISGPPTFSLAATSVSAGTYSGQTTLFDVDETGRITGTNTTDTVSVGNVFAVNIQGTTGQFSGDVSIGGSLNFTGALAVDSISVTGDIHGNNVNVSTVFADGLQVTNAVCATSFHGSGAALTSIVAASATNASYAASAGEAAVAVSANHATSANTALFAGSATNATNAVSAVFASSATNATNAVSAVFANSATNATNAINVDYGGVVETSSANLGTVSASDMFVSGPVSVGGTVDVSGAVSIGGGLFVVGDVSAGNIYAGGVITGDGSGLFNVPSAEGGTVKKITAGVGIHAIIDGTTVTDPIIASGTLALNANQSFGTVSASSLSISASASFADNAVLNFGDSNDLTIQHNGSNSLITESGTGSLFVQSNDIRLTNTGSFSMLTLTDGQDAEFPYGVQVSGTVSATSFVGPTITSINSVIAGVSSTMATSIDNTNTNVTALSATMATSIDNSNTNITTNTNAITSINSVIAGVSSALATSINNTNTNLTALSATMATSIDNSNTNITTNTNAITSINSVISGVSSTLATSINNTNSNVTALSATMATSIANHLPLAGGTMTGNLILNGAPSANLQAATKQYVDNLTAAAIHFHTAVRVESPDTAGNLNATYDNGTSGVGATLTNAGTQAALVIDGVTLNTSDRVLIYNQTNGYENGVYTVTNTGSASTNWVLTRATDADSYEPNDNTGIDGGSYFFVEEGDTGAGEAYVCSNVGTITIGTTDITFTLFSSALVYTAGSGININGSRVVSTSGVPTNADLATVSATLATSISNHLPLAGGTLTGTVSGTNASFSGNVSASNFYGDGSNLTNLPTAPTSVSSYTVNTLTIVSGATLNGDNVATSSAISAVSATMATSIANQANAITSINNKITAVSGALATSINNSNSAITALSATLAASIGNQATDTRVNALSATLATSINNSNTNITTNTNAITSINNVTTSINSKIATVSSTLATSISTVNSRITSLSATFATSIANQATDSRVTALSATFATSIANQNQTITAGNGLTGGGSGNVTLNVGAGTGISVAADSVGLATAGAGAGTYGSTSNNTKIDTITLDAYGRVTAVATGGTGDIDGVTAGSGLTGGGTSGTVTLNVGAGTGVTVNANDIAIGQAVGTGNSVTFAGVNINGNLNAVDNIYLARYLYHEGDTDTYIDFVAANEMRVVTGGSENLRFRQNYIQAYENVVGSVETSSKTGSVTPDLQNYNSFVWTLTGNITLNNPSTEIAGMSGVFIFIHSGAGRTVSLGTDWETAGGAGLTLSSASGAVDIVPYYVQASGNILLGTPQLAFS
jgi:cytoskeletal protein CcmA (bactofilin family)